MKVRKDCRHFKGYIPCKFHKLKGVHCEYCPDYEKINKKLLIIKLGSIGDVIRTTPLLHRMKKEYPDAQIFWLTYFPEVVPSLVDQVLNFELRNIVYLQSVKFDLLINLDKAYEACALASQIEADDKRGFILKEGRIVPINDDALHKWLTGLSDELNRANTKSYLEEIFEICGYKFNKERYILELDKTYEWDINEPRPLVGLNTGCGERWKTRLWPTKKWIELAKKLKASGYGVILLGGKAEDERNKLIKKESEALYLGYFPLQQFFSLLNQCDLIVTSVSMALHVAIGLNKKVVLFNNIFNRNEFEMYGLGEIIEPDVDCLGCFKNKFDSKCEVRDCMDIISIDMVENAIKKILGK